jgi:hypothetical protein
VDRSTAAANATTSAAPRGSSAAQALGRLLGHRPPVLLDLRAACRRAYRVEVTVSAALTMASLVFGFLLLISALQPATAQDLHAPLLASGALAGVLLGIYLTWRRCRPQPGTGFRDTLESREIDIVRGVFRIHVYDRQTLARHSRCEIGFDRLVALCEVEQRHRLLPWPRRPMARLTLVERGTGLDGPRRAPLWAIHTAPAVRAAPRRKGAASAWDSARTAWVPPAEMHEVIQVFVACTGLHVRHAAIEPDTSSSSETLSISH